MLALEAESSLRKRGSVKCGWEGALQGYTGSSTNWDFAPPSLGDLTLFWVHGIIMTL